MRIVVTAAYSQSLHAVGLIHGLVQQGHQVVMCMNVTVLNYGRFREYVRRMGWKGLWQMVSNRLSMGQTGTHLSKEIIPMIDYLGKRGIASRTVQEACRAVGARHVKVKSLNTPDALNILREANPDLIAYAGGGLVKKDFIGVPRLGVVNAHGGPLPQFRGMHVVYWALFHGVHPAITVHYIDPGVDTGPIILQKLIEVKSWNDIFAERGTATCVGVDSLLQAIGLIAEGQATATPQAPEEGRQFFIMCDPLLEILHRWIDEGRTPQILPKDFRFPKPVDSAG